MPVRHVGDLELLQIAVVVEVAQAAVDPDEASEGTVAVVERTAGVEVSVSLQIAETG